MSYDLKSFRGNAAAMLVAIGGVNLAADELTASYPAEDCAHCAAWNTPQAPFRIYGNSYFVGTAGLAAVLVTSAEGHVLIDAGLPDSAPLIAENVVALGFALDDIKLILNSHAHFDHAGGIAALQRASGARVLASTESAAVMRTGRAAQEDPQFGQLLDFPPLPAVEVLPGNQPVVLGPLELTPHSTPAHTAGGTTWSWQSCEEQQCLSLVYADSQTAISDESYRFSRQADLASFDLGYALLEQLPCDILLTPHPGASRLFERRTEPSGLVDSTACQRYAAAARAQLARRIVVEQAGE